MHFHRRIILKGLIAAAAGSIVAALGLLKPRSATAAEWPRDAYGATTVAEALRNLYGTSETVESSAVKIRAPARMVSGAVVPISISTDLRDVRAISIMIEKNAPPLAAHLNVGGGIAFFAVNVKMASTSDVHAVVNANGTLYVAKQTIEVAAGA